MNSLWSRLLLHFWALEVERSLSASATPDPVEYLQSAFEETIRATSTPNEWLGTTTSATALLHWTTGNDGKQNPLLYVTNLGDCKILVIRPSEEKILFSTTEQWHWFDCPLQLGTNSVDTPRKDAVMTKVAIQEGDIVLAVSDGVMDNLWEHEVMTIILDSLKKWDQGNPDTAELASSDLSNDRLVYVAREVMNAALSVAHDPYAESPYMEKAIDEGLAIEGGTFDCCPIFQDKRLTFFRQIGRHLCRGCFLSQTSWMMSTKPIQHKTTPYNARQFALKLYKMHRASWIGHEQLWLSLSIHRESGLPPLSPST